MSSLTWTASVKSLLGLIFGGSDSNRSVLPFIPRPVRLLFVLLLILNARSFPYAWHLRVFRPLLAARLKWLSLTFASKRSKDAFIASLSSVGKSPFELRSTYTSWVSPDDADYNIHLSNSCYSKLLDMVRMKFAIEHLTPVFRDGCWIALGASHLRFVREIPAGSTYEVRMYCGAWDEKWVYVVSRFVSKKSNKRAGMERQDSSREPSNQAVPFPELHTPASGLVSTVPSGTTTPIPSLVHGRSTANLSDALNDIDCLWPEAADETLHCVVVNELCFKSGRITVPPRLALAYAGCGLEGEAWARVQALRKLDMAKGKGIGKGSIEGRTDGKAGPPTLKELLRGVWRDVPPEERWWDQALAPFEKDNERRLGVLRGLREGLAAVQSL